MLSPSTDTLAAIAIAFNISLVARTITITAAEALQDAPSTRIADERKSIAEVARDALEAALGGRSLKVPFGRQRGPRLFTLSVTAWQRTVRRRQQP
jgi:hypothetical protein